MEKVKLTKELIDGLTPDPEKEYTRWDLLVRGFGIRVRPNGQKAFVLMYSRNDRLAKVTLGRYGDLTVDQARKEAEKKRGIVAQGQDPAEEKRKAREGMTFEGAADQFLREHKAHIAQKTYDEYERQVKAMKAYFGLKRKVKEIELRDFKGFHQSLADTPRKANLALAVLSVLLSYCEVWGERPVGSNPCSLIRRFEENQRERYLTPEELGRVGAALEALQDKLGPGSADCLRLAILTGMRKGEARSLLWAWVDLDGACIRFPQKAHKTGRKTKRGKVVPLGLPAVDLLRSLKVVPWSPFVFHGRKPGTCIANLNPAWDKVRILAEVPDVRIHDLRHTWGSEAINSGEALKLVGAVLGQKHQATTERYTHAALTPALGVAERTSQRLARALRGEKETGEVVEAS